MFYSFVIERRTVSVGPCKYSTVQSNTCDHHHNSGYKVGTKTIHTICHTYSAHMHQIYQTKVFSNSFTA